MAEKKIVESKTQTTDTNKNSGLNIDLSELKKIGAAILAFVASNPELISKLLAKPAAYLKKIVKGEEVSKDTKKKVNKTIDDSKSGGITSILTSLSNLSGGDKDTSSVFDKISSTVKNTKTGIDIASVASSLLGSGSNSKKTTKKASNSSIGNILKGLFK